MEFISSDFKQLEIGTLQPLHAEVQMNFENFQFYEQNKAAAKEIIQYKNQMTGINSGIKIQNRKLTDAKKSEKLERNKYNRIKTLVASNDKSPQELENQEKIWISSQTRVKEIE